MADVIVFFLLFILPFIIAPFGVTQFENPKVIVGEIGIILLLITALFSKQTKISFRPRQLYLYFAILILSLVHVIFFKTELSFFGNVFRMQGIFLLWFLLLFSVLSSNSSFKKIPWFTYTFLLLVQLVAMYFLYVDENNRRIGTLGEPNAAAAFAIFLWPLSIFAIRKFGTSEKIGVLITLTIVMAILILTNSRSAMIAFAIQLVFILLQKTNISLVKTTFACFLLYLFSYILPFFDHAQFESRVQIWQSAVWANSNNFLFGHGFGNMERAIHESANQLGLLVQYNYIDSAHNLFLDWWVQGGIVGATVLILLISFTLMKFIRENNKRELVLLLGMITVLSFNPGSFVGLIGFWWLIGQGMREVGEPGETRTLNQ